MNLFGICFNILTKNKQIKNVYIPVSTWLMKGMHGFVRAKRWWKENITDEVEAIVGHCHSPGTTRVNQRRVS